MTSDNYFREVGENSHYWDYPVYCSDGISWTNQLLIGRNMLKNMQIALFCFIFGQKNF
jgi:hypothetical protein